MKQYESIGQMIKWFIKCRNKTIKQTAYEMGIKYTTFSEQIKNNTMSAETLFRLAAYLDIDLNWMMIVLGYHGTVSSIEREITPRMSSEFREREADYVEQRLACIIEENPGSTADARRELLHEFHKNAFYLLDVLVPEEYNIYMTSERDKPKYYVDFPSQTTHRRTSMMMRKTVSILYDEIKVLDLIIEERKALR